MTAPCPRPTCERAASLLTRELPWPGFHLPVPCGMPPGGHKRHMILMLLLLLPLGLALVLLATAEPPHHGRHRNTS